MFRFSSHFFASLQLLLLTCGSVTTTTTANQTKKCPYDCGPFGDCNFNPLMDEYKCHCDEGWSGANCAIIQTECPTTITGIQNINTDKYCYNGGVCEWASYGMRCNCEHAMGDAATNQEAPAQCEYPESSYDICEEGREKSLYAFCVNGGTCYRKVAPGDEHPFCNCPTGFAGRHCQFTSDQAPMEELIYVDSGGYEFPKIEQQETSNGSVLVESSSAHHATATKTGVLFPMMTAAVLVTNAGLFAAAFY